MQERRLTPREQHAQEALDRLLDATRGPDRASALPDHPARCYGPALTEDELARARADLAALCRCETPRHRRAAHGAPLPPDPG